jgi:hypothetical protein
MVIFVEKANSQLTIANSQMMSRINAVQVSDTRDDDRSTKADSIK